MRSCTNPSLWTLWTLETFDSPLSISGAVRRLKILGDRADGTRRVRLHRHETDDLRLRRTVLGAHMRLRDAAGVPEALKWEGRCGSISQSGAHQTPGPA